MHLYARKLGRELRRQKGQVIAVTAVTALGVMLFVASAAAYLDLKGSYASTRQRLALADLTVDADVTDADAARVAATPGVRVAEVRAVAELPVRIADARVQLRVLSLPERGQPALDQVLIQRGALPGGDDQVLLEKHLAAAHHLGPGDAITVDAAGGTRRLTVSGVAVSAEYLWVARDREDFMPSADAFGVGWMRRSALRGVAQAIVAAAPGAGDGLASAAGDGGDQLLVARASGGEASLRAAVDHVLGPRVRAATAADDLLGIKLLSLDVEGYKGMAAFFPLFFLGVGAFIVASIMARLVDAQRALVGTLMALGVERRRVLAHYVTWGLVLGGVGAVLGAGLGLVVAPAMTHAYAQELGIPYVSVGFHADLAVTGIGIGLAVALLASLLPAWHASRLVPAEAMRPPRPSTSALARLARRLPAPLPVRLALRNLLGHPLRSIATSVGVAAALVLVLATGALFDSMKTTFSAQFSTARRDDLRVALVGPEPAADVTARLAAIPGVRAAEGVLALPVVVRGGGGEATALVQGLPDDARLVRSVDSDGRVVPPPRGGVVITRALSRTLQVGVGDTLDLAPAVAGASSAHVRLAIAGYADATMGNTISARRDELAPLVGAPGMVTEVAVATDPGRVAAVRDALDARPDAARVEDTAAMRTQMSQLMGLGWVMLGAMLAFSGILAAAILFNTATLGVLERSRELATLRALGRTLRELAVGLTTEHVMIAALGVAIGLPLASITTHALLDAFSTDLFALPYVMSGTTITIAVAGIVAILLVAQWPALRQVGKMSLADAVRTRDG